MARFWTLYGALAATCIRDVTAGVAFAPEKYDLQRRADAVIQQPDPLPQESPVPGQRIDINSLEGLVTPLCN